MNRQDFTGYIHHPQLPDQGAREDLRNLAERYPYCSSIQVLYTLVLLAGNDHEFSLQLKKTAAYAPSRKKLKDLIDAVRVSARPVPLKQEAIPEPLPGTIPGGDIPITEPAIEEPASSMLEPVISLSKEAIIEKFIREEPRISSPRITFFTPSESALRSSTDEAEIVSETLARLYSEQGNTAKARQVYEKLCLLFPEKSSYFAAQIEKLG
jgi:hypothetical protein